MCVNKKVTSRHIPILKLTERPKKGKLGIDHQTIFDFQSFSPWKQYEKRKENLRNAQANQT